MNVRSTRALLLLAGAALAVGPQSLRAQAAAAGQAGTTPGDLFPHAAHQGLFPLCTGCHEGAGTDATAPLYPEAVSCVGCHDGADLDPVEWTEPRTLTSQLDYTHGQHRAEVAQSNEPLPDCATCHAPSVEDRWSVEPVRAEGCWTCHDAVDHYAESNDCTTCHVPLSSSSLIDTAVSQWAPPPDHEEEGFLESLHGQLELSLAANRCATCHTQNQCTSCHVDARLEAVQSIPIPPPSLASLVIEPAYPTPQTHELDRWLEVHGVDFESNSCTTCHTREDCTSCHVGPTASAVGAVTARHEAKAPGVGLSRSRPASHASPEFEFDHGGLAASAPAQCATCHLQPDCVRCHIGDGLTPAQPTVAVRLSQPSPVVASAIHAPGVRSVPSQGGFHPMNFVLSHANDSWNGLLECSSCHDTQLFCRSCHQESGVSSSGRLGPGYHDTQPLWLLRHGQSARQALESCASCHRQVDCLQCHSTIGAFRVSPHGSGFDADDVQEKAGRTCFACHLGGPPAEGGS